MSNKTQAGRVHAMVNDGGYPGMSKAFDAHMGASCWVDPAYRPDASTWAAAWKAAVAAERERWQARVQEAFKEGFYAPRTYNDTVLNTADEAWEEAKAGLLRPNRQGGEKP